MAPRKKINKKKCKNKKKDDVVCYQTNRGGCASIQNLPKPEKKTSTKETPPADAVLASAVNFPAIVILTDGMKHESAKTFYFYDGDEIIVFRGYALQSTAFDDLQKAVDGYIEYIPYKLIDALRKAGYGAMVCNDTGVYQFADKFNADAWAFIDAKVELFGPVVLLKKGK